MMAQDYFNNNLLFPEEAISFHLRATIENINNNNKYLNKR